MVRKHRRSKQGWLGLIAGTALIILATETGTYAADRVAEGDEDFATVAAALGIGLDEVRRQKALTDEAGELQVQLEELFPTEFAGLWIDRDSGFQIVAAFTTHREAEVKAISGGLSGVLETQVHKHSLAELHRMQRLDLATLDMPHTTGVDVRSNQVRLTVLEGTADVARKAVGELPEGVVQIVETEHMPLLVGDSYGGLWMESYQDCGPGGNGTSGWSVQSDTLAFQGIMTAGHLDNCLRYPGGNNWTLESESSGGGISDAQWHLTPNWPDRPWFQWHQNGSTRIVQDKKGKAQLVIGEWVCMFGQNPSTPYNCGQINDLSVDLDGSGAQWQNKFIEVERCDQTGPLVDSGDSGGPVFWGSTAYGIITARSSGDTFCGNKMIFNSVTQIQNALDVHLILGSP